jgi:uncharacterized protein YjbI with pentapeptide repeats
MAKKKSAAWPAARFPGKTFVLDANVQSREDIEQFIAEEGGRALPAVAAALDYFVTGYRRGNKKSAEQKSAEELNSKGAAIALLTEEQFYALLLPTREEALVLLNAGEKGRMRWQRLWNHWWGLTTPLDLDGVDLRGKKLAHCNLGRFTLNHADLRDADLTGACLPPLTDATLDGACLCHASFSQASHCSFKQADATDAHVNPAVFTSCDFTGAVLRKLGGPYSQATDCVFRNADLSEAWLEQSKLQQADFTGANLTAARLPKCDLTGAKLAGARLAGADLTDAMLVGADLRKAVLTDAVLVNADLTNALIEGADFTGANLAGVNLGGIDPSQAIGLVVPSGPGGQIGPNIRELEKVAHQSRRLETGAVIDLKDGRVEVMLTYHGKSGWITTHLKAPSGGITSGAQTLSAGMIDLTRKWTHGTLCLESITAKVSKGPLRSRDLLPLAVAAWCEACGTPVPAAPALQQELDAHSEQQKQLRQQMLAELRGGAAGVALWNARPVEQRRQAGPYRGVDLSGMDLSGANLSGEWPSWPKRERMDWQRAVFDRAKLARANLCYCDLGKARFHNADLRELNCGIAKLSGADFTGASLRKAHLRVCTFCRAIFHNADLRQADFGYADLRGADLSTADLRGATFEHAKYDAQTRFPPGFVAPADMKWMGAAPARSQGAPPPAAPAGSVDFPTFMANLAGAIDAARLSKALNMLKADRFQLFAEVKEADLVGVVKSQTDKELVYSCRLAADGSFACGTQNLRPCGGLQGALCKHLLVLIVGLVKAGKLDAAAAQQWVGSSRARKPALDKERMTATFLRYKGAEAGEVDWRPTETIPEDYYAL